MTEEREVLSVGIDIGCESTKTVLGPQLSCEIVRNQVGEHTTPTAVAFSGRNRYVGEAASHYASSPNAVTHLNRLLVREDDFLKPFYRYQLDDESLVSVEYNGTTQKFDSCTLLAMFLSKIRQNVQSTLDRMQGTSSNGNSKNAYVLEYVLALPEAGENNDNGDSFNKIRTLWENAAYGAGLDRFRIVDSATCEACALVRKFPNENVRTVMVVDMGHAQTTVSIIKCGCEETKDNDNKFQVLNTCVDFNFGAASVDVALWFHFQSALPDLKDVTPNSKAGYRLLTACRKLKHLLSQLPSGQVTVENINDKDVVLSANRALLVEKCHPSQQALSNLIQRALSIKKGDIEIDAVEVVGGGCRIPWVKETILKALPNNVSTLSHGLDDTSVALGAAVVSLSKASKLEQNSVRLQLRQAEQDMAALDNEMKQRAAVQNQMEAHVLEMRAARNSSKHASLLPMDELTSHLDATDEWLMQHDHDAMTCEELENKLQQVLETTKTMCRDYFDAVQQETQAKEAEMEQQAKLAQANQEQDEEDEDHDNRRLPKKRRMEMVLKNKKEANELFADGNHRHAAARYNKALTHCSKFVDLSPDDVTEVNDVKLSLNLNLALAYLKLDMLDQALRVCNDALQIDEDSTKALYRRATVYYEKKQWDKASLDVAKALVGAPKDKAIQKLNARIELQMKKQKSKEKKMAQKMFG